MKKPEDDWRDESRGMLMEGLCGIVIVLLVFFIVLYAGSKDGGWNKLLRSFHPGAVKTDTQLELQSGADGDLSVFAQSARDYVEISGDQSQITVTGNYFSGDDATGKTKDVCIRLTDFIRYSTADALQKGDAYDTFDYIAEQLAKNNDQISAVIIKVSAADGDALDYRSACIACADAAAEYIAQKSGFPKAKLFSVTSDFSRRPADGSATYVTDLYVIATGTSDAATLSKLLEG
ncbi:MAG: hypothetical protein QM689_07790 [Oscillospiraceae bacterium]